MTLGGIAIAIGELVDDAVVDVENIFRRLRENRAAGNPRSVFDVVVAASQEVRSGILYASVIIVLVFVPLFALSGIEGRLFAPLGQAYIISILASLVVSITLTPVMAYYMLPGLKRLDEHESPLVRVLKRALSARRSIARWTGGRARRRCDIARGRDAPRPARSCCRARSCRRSTRAPSPSTWRSIRASRSPNPTASAGSPSASCSRCRRSSRSAGAPAAPSSTSMPRACIRPISKSISSRAARPKTEIVADIRSRLVGAAAVDQRRPADLAPARPHAVGRARRDRA